MSTIKHVVACSLLLAVQQNPAFSALESTSVQPIHGNAPLFTPNSMGTHVVLTKDNYRVDYAGIAEVGDIIEFTFTIADQDLDEGIDALYGFFGRKDSEGKDADTYFIFTDVSGNKTKIDPSQLSRNDIRPTWLIDKDEGRITIGTASYTLKPTDIGGKIGLNTAPASKYGLPNVGKVHSGDNVFQIDGIDIEMDMDADNVWPVRPNALFKVGIWKTEDVTGTGDQQEPPVGVLPYSHKKSKEFLSLDESYTALIWYDENDNGIYETGEIVFHKLYADPLQYKWSLQKGNSAANGTVPSTTTIELITDANNTIVLPQTNAEVFTKWPAAAVNGLPKNEAGIQGFTLVVEVD